MSYAWCKYTGTHNLSDVSNNQCCCNFSNLAGCFISMGDIVDCQVRARSRLLIYLLTEWALHFELSKWSRPELICDFSSYSGWMADNVSTFSFLRPPPKPIIQMWIQAVAIILPRVQQHYAGKDAAALNFHSLTHPLTSIHSPG
jgi:hypothetical protein